MRKRITRRIDEKKGYMRDPKLEISNASEQAPADQSKRLSYRFLYISSLPSPPPPCVHENTRVPGWIRALQVTLLTGPLPILHRASMCGINCTFVERFKTLRMDVS